MHRESPTVRPTRSQRGGQQGQLFQQCRSIPYPSLAALIGSRNNRHVKYLKGRAQFWYQPNPLEKPDEWKRAYGLTKMLGHTFWPDYDPTNEQYMRVVAQTKQQYYALRSKKLKRYGQHKAALRRQMGGNKGGRGFATSNRKGFKSTQEIMQLSTDKPKEYYGIRLGELVHKQLHVWALDRLCGIHHFGRDASVEWPANDRTLAIIRCLSQELQIDVRFGEFMIYDPRVPVATSIDLLGWSKHRRSVVIIEIKTGSKWTRDMGTGPMRGRAPRVLRLSNAPLNQALAQLASTTATIRQCYNVPRVDGLLIWANQWLVPVPEVPVGPQARYPPNWANFQPAQTEVQIYKHWLSEREQRMGSIMLGEMHKHLEARGGRAWAKTKATKKY